MTRGEMPAVAAPSGAGGPGAPRPHASRAERETPISEFLTSTHSAIP